MEDYAESKPKSAKKDPDAEKAGKMIKHFKKAGKLKDDAFWVEYDADDLRRLLDDKSIQKVKFITAAYEADGEDEKKDYPTILVQFRHEAGKDGTQAVTFSYKDSPGRICPPPSGGCDAASSYEI